MLFFIISIYSFYCLFILFCFTTFVDYSPPEMSRPLKILDKTQQRRVSTENQFLDCTCPLSRMLLWRIEKKWEKNRKKGGRKRGRERGRGIGFCWKRKRAKNRVWLYYQHYNCLCRHRCRYNYHYHLLYFNFNSTLSFYLKYFFYQKNSCAIWLKLPRDSLDTKIF